MTTIMVTQFIVNYQGFILIFFKKIMNNNLNLIKGKLCGYCSKSLISYVLNYNYQERI